MLHKNIYIYRNASNKRPGRLLNFCEFKGGVYSRGAFKKKGRAFIKFFCLSPLIIDKDPFA